MSKLISQLLGAKEPLFALSLKQLEDLTGRPGTDVRLTAEIINQAKLKTKELGLDPLDTTGEELYLMLQHRLKNDDHKLLQIIGCNEPNNLPSLFENIKNLLDKQPKKRCWVLKKSVAKSLVKQNPPKNVMKAMHYKSVDSMLKTGDIDEIYAATRFAESTAWQNKFLATYKKLSPTDFEERDIEIIVLTSERWLDLATDFVKTKKHNVTHLKELGVVAILPINEGYKTGLAITTVPLLLHYFNEVKLYSSFFKLHQARTDFGDILYKTINGDHLHIAKITGHHIHWRILQRYYGKLSGAKHPEIFEPHLQPEDLHWHKAEELLYELDPELGWWRGLDYVGVPDASEPVAFNLMDNAISLVNKASYKSRNYYHFRESLWNEIFARYMGENILESTILDQLDKGMVMPEIVKSTTKQRIKY